jgi:hypothetical protein
MASAEVFRWRPTLAAAEPAASSTAQSRDRSPVALEPRRFGGQLNAGFRDGIFGIRSKVIVLTQDEIADISLAVIQGQERSLHLIGVVSSEGGSDRIELVITINGCHDEPCMLVLNLTRSDRSELATELRDKLRTALGAHKVAS